MDARFRISGHTKNNWPKQQQKQNRNSKVTHSCEQWTEIEVGKLSCLFWQFFADIVIFSLSKKSISLDIKTGLCTRIWYHLFLVRIHTIRDSKHNEISSLTEESIYTCVLTWHCLKVDKLYREIVLCYLLFWEVYTHLHLGLHCCDEDAVEWP